MSEELVRKLAQDVGGKIEEIQRLPDGSGFAVMSMPLPKDHWLTKDDGSFEEPPMPFRIGQIDAPVLNRDRKMWADDIRKAAKYAIRASTMKGKEQDFDPDAMVQNFIVGMIGYHTGDGNSTL